VRHIGAENILLHVQGALDRAREVQGEFDGLGKKVAGELWRGAL
jgi:hypothetical protein